MYRAVGRATALIGTAAAVLLTCVPAATAIPGGPSDPTDPEPCLPVGSPLCDPDPVPDIHLPWAGMELPTISVGLSSVRTVSVSNQGDPGSVLALEAPTFTGEVSTPEFALDAAGSTCDDGGWPRELAAGEECTLAVRFAPVVAGHRTGTMRLASNDPDEEPQFSLYGTALTPARLRFGSGGIDFGAHDVGTTTERTVTLTNTGQARYYGSVTELGAAADFEMVRGCSSARPMEVIIGGGSSCTLTVSFTPPAPGPSVAQLRFVSELGEAQDLTLVGTGNPVGEPEDPADPTDPEQPEQPAAPDTTAPTVRISKVTIRPARRTVRVAFVGADDVSARSELRYRCRVDRGATRPCTSPASFKRLKPGRHVVRVRAVDVAGNTGPAAVARFRLRR